MKIVVDENIPQGKEAFGEFGEIVLSGGRKITNEMLKDTDILIVRSITQVNEELLKNTNVKFVGTATIGTDHVDKEYLNKENIRFADASGCNAFSVAEYVIDAITQYLVTSKKRFEDQTIGVVGYGNVGKKVVRFAKALDMKVLINDPPLERLGEENIFCSLSETLTADIVTFHVPLNKTGIDKTVHLLNGTNIDMIRNGGMLINSSRGPVVDNSMLLEKFKSNKKLYTILDVWENEPALNRDLLNLVDFGTSHIAGYSFEGKINGTTIIRDRLCEFLNIKPDWKANYPVIENNSFTFDSNNDFENEFKKLVDKIYDLKADSDKLKKAISMDDETSPKYFDELRKKYHIRREFNNYKVKAVPPNDVIKNRLESLRFQVI